MIREQDLDEAIAECEGTLNPNANTCIKLAAFYIVKDQLYGKKELNTVQDTGYSYESRTEIPYSNSHFSEIVEQVGIEKAFPVIDELMEMLFVTNRPLYESVLRKIEY